MKKSLLLPVILSILLFQPAYATTFTEVVDAGQLLSTASIVTGSGELTKIYGTLSGYNDVDLYGIHIDDIEAFSVTVSSELSKDDDTMLWLFDSSGILVIQDDDSGTGGYIPQFNSGDLTGLGAAGDYFLGLSLYRILPLGTPLSGWDTDPSPQQEGSYTFTFTGASFSAVPEPATMMLFGIGLLSFARFVRREESTTRP